MGDVAVAFGEAFQAAWVAGSMGVRVTFMPGLSRSISRILDRVWGAGAAGGVVARRAPLGAPGSPAIYAASATGVAWMCSWHGAQTMSVLRRIRAIRAAHAGLPGPGLPRSASAAIWWTATVAPCSHSSHHRLRSR